jgi:selenocysteine lyase/cysteine desulfurase
MKTSQTAFVSAISIILTISSIVTTSDFTMTITPLGRHIRSQFLLEPNYTSLNHGSYGSIPKVIVPVLQDLHAKAEINPDRWLRREMFPEIDKNKATLAELIHSDPEELVFVFNAMTGINTVARSLPLEAGDKIIYVTLMHISTLIRQSLMIFFCIYIVQYCL